MSIHTKHSRSRQSKSTRRGSAKQQQKPSKHQKTNHNCSSSSCYHESSSSSLDFSYRSRSSMDCSSRSRKSVTFSEVVNVRPLHEEEPPKKKKSVSFNEVVMVRSVLHLDDYSDQEMLATWFVMEDKQLIKADILNTLRLVKDGKFHGCTRGLEKLSDGGRTRERRLVSIRDVLEEQKQQRKLHKSKNGEIVYDHSKLRKAYKPHSRAARHVAHAVGKIDEMAAASQRVEIPAFGTKSLN